MKNKTKKVLNIIYRYTINKIPCKFFGVIEKNKKYVYKFMYKCVGINVKITCGYNFSIGNFSTVGENSFIQDTEEIIIKNNVIIGPEIMIFTSNHSFDKNSIIRLQQSFARKVVINDDVWIGARTMIMPGVTIGTGAL